MEKVKIDSKKYFKELDKIEEKFYDEITKLELKMAKETGVEDIEFFFSNNSIVGIGNVSRTMKLINRG